MKDTIIKVRGFHLDIYRHVNNARYLEFLEEARWDIFEETNLIQELNKKNIGVVIANNNITYKRPATFGDILEIKTKVLEFDRRKGVLEQIIYFFKTDKIVCKSLIGFVFVDLKTGRATDADDELFEKFKTLQ